MPDQKTCVTCGREGVQGYTETPQGPVCSNMVACGKRVEAEKRRHGLWRFENGDSHYYKLDGERVPGVTTLIKNGLPSGGLIQWGIRTTAEWAAQHVDEIWAMRGLGEDAIKSALEKRPFQVRNDAGVRGKILHDYAERLHRGEKVDLKPEHEHLLPWVQSVADYLNDHEPKSVLQETAIGNRRWNYGGTLDDVSDFPERRTSDGKILPAGRRVVDYKSGNHVMEKDCLQLAAYRWAEIYKDPLTKEDRPLSELGLMDEGYIVHVRPEGYRLIPFYIGPEVFQAFLRVAWIGKELVGDYRKGTGLMREWMGEPLARPEGSM